ncbi:Acetyltransferase (GNAT) domain-containing protein [Palleronia salina]|uniref:Acetyltransferase (GNAT) domain-containing protein n=2 Tax=Palleronia salina TaxID=313368 RepID=A0A1M6H663_9RHOB|nr:Acetyltransferase (GNAT) domain-containing protein [Palleronia salina]
MTACCRVARAGEVAVMLDWAAAEGWNPGLDDAAAFHAADPDGFFVSEVGGQVVAAISVVNHSDAFAFLGLYLCRPEFRGRGIGFALWNFARSHAGDRTVGLDGVAAQQANYARSGFVLYGRTQRLSGHLATEALTLPVARAVEIPEIERLDAAANGVSRPGFLHTWLQDGPTRKTVLGRDGKTITGVATARTCRDGCKIGPIIADDAHAALHLARQAASAVGESRVTIDVPDTAAPFAELLRQQGFTEGFSTARMYSGDAPAAGQCLQAVATLELG